MARVSDIYSKKDELFDLIEDIINLSEFALKYNDKKSYEESVIQILNDAIEAKKIIN